MNRDRYRQKETAQENSRAVREPEEFDIVSEADRRHHRPMDARTMSPKSGSSLKPPTNCWKVPHPDPPPELLLELVCAGAGVAGGRAGAGEREAIGSAGVALIASSWQSRNFPELPSSDGSSRRLWRFPQLFLGWDLRSDALSNHKRSKSSWRKRSHVDLNWWRNRAVNAGR